MIDKAKELVATARTKMSDAVKFLEEDLKTYRVGKANPLIFNNIVVDYYGTPTPVPQVASVTTPDARTLVIQPWEKKMIPVIEKAIMDANIGLNVLFLTNSFDGLYSFRKELIKKVKAAGENAKVVVRNARRDAIDALKKAQKDGLPEDAEKDFEQNVQKDTDSFVKNIDELVSSKEKEILTV